MHVEATRMPTRIVVCEGGTCEFVPKRELDASEAENAKLRELVRDIYGEYRYLRVRFHRTYVQHEERMRAVEQRMRELGVEVDE